MKALEMALEALTNPSTIAVQHAIELIKAELAKPEMPTKIVGPNLEQILNAAGFYRRGWVGLTDDDCIEAQKNSWNEYKNGKELKFDGFKLCKNIEQILKEKNGG